jgi:hypothetical protein
MYFYREFARNSVSAMISAHLPKSGGSLAESPGFLKEPLRRFPVPHLDLSSLGVQTGHHLIG